MKIVIFNPLRDTAVRGISRYAVELTQHLRTNGAAVQEVVFPVAFGRLPKALQILLFVIWQQLLLPIQVLLRRPHLVIEPYNCYSVLTAALTPTLCVYHDFIPMQRGVRTLKPSTLYQRSLQLSARWLPRLRIGCVSPRTLAEATRYIPGKRASLLPNLVTPLSDDDVPCEHREVLLDECARLSRDGYLTVCTVSGDGANKDFAGLVSALSGLGRPVYLVAFGFPETGPLEQQGAGDCETRVMVRRVGRVAGATIARVMRSTDAFVFHSLSEGFGRPVPEALLEHRVIVSADVPALDMLSDDALRNVVVCPRLSELPECLEVARSRRFQPMGALFKLSPEDAVRRAVLDS